LNIRTIQNNPVFNRGGDMAEKRRCGAKRRNGEPCRKWALKGKKRCRIHGGASTGAPKKNKNAVKTGEYETIWLDVLEPEEVEMFENMAIDAIKQLDDDIKLINIRIRRMLERIKDLKQHDFTLVSYKEGMEKGDATDLKEYEGTLGQIQAIEESLTRLQKEKAKLIEIKHKIQEGQGDADESAEWVKAIQAVADKRKMNGGSRK
jgi:uncharacterized protein YjcR